MKPVIELPETALERSIVDSFVAATQKEPIQNLIRGQELQGDLQNSELETHLQLLAVENRG